MRRKTLRKAQPPGGSSLATNLIVGTVTLLASWTLEQIGLRTTGERHLGIVDRFLGELLSKRLHLCRGHFLHQEEELVI